MNFIVYEGSNGEVIVTTPKQEKKMLRAYFPSYEDRNIYLYDRSEVNEDGAVVIKPSLKIG